MKFLIDQDVYATTVRFIKNLGHDVVLVEELGLSQEKDISLLQKAKEDNRIFITRDRDFGGLIFVAGLGAGVIYIRMLPSNKNAVHNELERILNYYQEEDLKNAFLVVEPGRHRFRSIKKSHKK